MIRTLRRTMALLAQVTLVGCGRECFVGVSGTEASITVKATFPDETCQELKSNPARYVGDMARDGPQGFFSLSERPTQPILCEYSIDAKRFVVRDTGVFKVVGKMLCSGLAKRAD